MCLVGVAIDLKNKFITFAKINTIINIEKAKTTVFISSV